MGLWPRPDGATYTWQLIGLKLQKSLFSRWRSPKRYVPCLSPDPFSPQRGSIGLNPASCTFQYAIYKFSHGGVYEAKGRNER